MVESGWLERQKNKNLFPEEAVEGYWEIICIHLEIPYNCRVNEDGNG